MPEALNIGLTELCNETVHRESFVSAELVARHTTFVECSFHGDTIGLAVSDCKFIRCEFFGDSWYE